MELTGRQEVLHSTVEKFSFEPDRRGLGKHSSALQMIILRSLQAFNQGCSILDGFPNSAPTADNPDSRSQSDMPEEGLLIHQQVHVGKWHL